MAELLIRVRDSYAKTGDDVFDSKVSRRGDVIVAMPDGWNWGVEELRNPDWRIIKLPNISLALANSLTSAEIATGPEPDPTLQFRGFKFDVDVSALPAAFKSYLTDNTRAAPFFTSSITAAQIASLVLKVKKLPWAQQKLLVQ